MKNFFLHLLDWFIGVVIGILVALVWSFMTSYTVHSFQPIPLILSWKILSCITVPIAVFTSCLIKWTNGKELLFKIRG